MISRLRPFLQFDDILAALSFWRKRPVETFEKAFAQKFGNNYAVAFSYGRTGIEKLLNIWELKGKEIIMPAYTCVVVANAVVKSGNIPVFIDCDKNSFNMNISDIEKNINSNTGAIIATHVFGYPMDVKRLDDIVKAQKQKIYVIQDCAHSFGAKHNGMPVNTYGDASLFALNISKYITSIFGGMVTTDDPEIFRNLKNEQSKLNKPNLSKAMARFLYLIAIYIGFRPSLYYFINLLERSNLLNRFVKYYDENKIDMPRDYHDTMLPIEARVGLNQLKKYDYILKKKIKLVESYARTLKSTNDFLLPPIVPGATYSHYVPIVKNRTQWINRGKEAGIQIGQLIEYSIPEMPAYAIYKKDNYPNAKYLSKHTINIPIHCYVNLKKIASYKDLIIKLLLEGPV